MPIESITTMFNNDLYLEIYDEHSHEIIGLCILLLTVLFLRFVNPSISLSAIKMPAASPQTVSAVEAQRADGTADLEFR